MKLLNRRRYRASFFPNRSEINWFTRDLKLRSEWGKNRSENRQKIALTFMRVNAGDALHIQKKKKTPHTYFTIFQLGEKYQKKFM